MPVAQYLCTQTRGAVSQEVSQEVSQQPLERFSTAHTTNCQAAVLFELATETQRNLQLKGDLGLKVLKQLVILEDVAVVGEAHAIRGNAGAGLDFLLELRHGALLGHGH